MLVWFFKRLFLIPHLTTKMTHHLPVAQVVSFHRWAETAHSIQEHMFHLQLCTSVETWLEKICIETLTKHICISGNSGVCHIGL